MAQFPDLLETTTLGFADEILLRQGSSDQRIPFKLACAITWCDHNGKDYLGLHLTGLAFQTRASVSYYEGDLYQVKQGVTLPYLATSNDPSTESSLSKIDDELSIVARSLNILDTDVIYTDYTTLPLPQIVFSKTEQKAYIVPVGARGKLIQTVAGSVLTTTDNVTYNLQTTESAYRAGRKNFITDGRFDFWFEGTSQTSSGYGSSTMWRNTQQGGTTKTVTRENTSFSELPPTAKYTIKTQVVSGGLPQSRCETNTAIEGVRTLAGKRAVLSFYAKVDSGQSIAFNLFQNFGTGGSPSATIAALSKDNKVVVSSGWERYSMAFDIPSLTGKTLGDNGDDKLQLSFYFDAGADDNALTDSLGNQSGTFDIACVQLEEGETATRFEEELPEAALSRVSRYFQERGDGGELSTFATGHVATVQTSSAAKGPSVWTNNYMRDNTPVVSFNAITLQKGGGALTFPVTAISAWGGAMSYAVSGGGMVSNEGYILLFTAGSYIRADARL